MSDTTIAFLLLAPFTILLGAVLISPQYLAAKKYGWKGLLLALVAELAVIFGGAQLFWLWNYTDWARAGLDEQTRIHEELMASVEAPWFIAIWIQVPTLITLCGALVILIWLIAFRQKQAATRATRS